MRDKLQQGSSAETQLLERFATLQGAPGNSMAESLAMAFKNAAFAATPSATAAPPPLDSRRCGALKAAQLKKAACDGVVSLLLQCSHTQYVFGNKYTSLQPSPFISHEQASEQPRSPSSSFK